MASMRTRRHSHERRSSSPPPALLGLLACWACANPNLYAVPRTVSKNQIEVVVAPEVTGFGGSEPGASDFDRLVPALPTVGVRYGLSKNVDIGGRLSNLVTSSGDIKWNPIRSSAFDLAIAPGAQIYQVQNVGDDEVDAATEASRTVFIANLPLLLGLNLSPSVVVVPTLGVSYAIAKKAPASASDIEQSQVIRGAFLRAGLGIRLRLIEHVALHPEFTVMRGVTQMDGYMLYMGGVGFVIGHLPEY